MKLSDMQQKLRNLREEMERLNRHDSRYLQLFTDEHNTLKDELKLVNEYKLKESEERELFYYLSTSLRNAQEKERARVERIKYLQLGLSVLCTSLGILSAFLYNYFRNANILEILNYDKEQFANVQSSMAEIMRKQDHLASGLNQNFESLGKKIQAQPPVRQQTVQTVQQSEPVKTEEQTPVKVENRDKDDFFYLHPYVLSAFFLFGFILFSANK
jgi:hypothetical protein